MTDTVEDLAPNQRYSDEVRKDAVTRAMRDGITQASRDLDIPKTTIDGWVRRFGNLAARMPPPDPVEIRSAPAAMIRAQLRNDFLSLAALMTDQIWQGIARGEVDWKTRKDALAAIRGALDMYRLEVGDPSEIHRNIPTLEHARSRLAELLGCSEEDLEATLARARQTRRILPIESSTLPAGSSLGNGFVVDQAQAAPPSKPPRINSETAAGEKHWGEGWAKRRQEKAGDQVAPPTLPAE